MGVIFFSNLIGQSLTTPGLYWPIVFPFIVLLYEENHKYEVNCVLKPVAYADLT